MSAVTFWNHSQVSDSTPITGVQARGDNCMNHWGKMPIYKEVTEFSSELKVRESISGNWCKFDHPSLARS